MCLQLDLVGVLLKARIKRSEGLRLKPYCDTNGVLTIGWGINLDEGIDMDEAELLLDHRIKRAKHDMTAIFLGVHRTGLNQTRTKVILEMLYNLGHTRFKTFKKMISAIKQRDYNKAADEMLDSKWAREDVGNRAIVLANEMREAV